MKDLILFTDTRDGNTYRTINIGNQCWFADNLKYLPQVASLTSYHPILFWKKKITKSIKEPYYYVYGYNGRKVYKAKSTNNYVNYGVLYNWIAAKQACPEGWHLPCNEEWMELVNYMKEKYNLLNDWEHTGCVGNALKSRRQIGSPLDKQNAYHQHPRWESINTPPPERKTISVKVGDHYGKDLAGFSALPGGRAAYNKFLELGFYGFWWSSSEYFQTRAWYWMMRHEFGDITNSNFDKSAGMSVRCIKNI
jgi:uncharacterized protein (TIGR02145 family)